MAEVWCDYVLITFYFLHVSCMSGSEFLCRDPDTGKLHTVNSTWSSTTFCGNYTCRIRKKNLSETEYAPMKQFNVSNLQMFIDNNHDNNEEQKEDRITDFVREVREKEEKNVYEDNPSEEDGYLTEDDIISITQILHLVKKSHLDAIIEIYKLAQTIYREIDDGSKQTPVDATLTNAIDEPLYSFQIDQVHNEPSSYRYGPLNSLVNANIKDEDIQKQETNTLISVAKSDKADTYFNGPLYSNDFRRVSYYYPTYDFQKSTSYYKPLTPAPVYSPPCNKKEEQNKGSSVKNTPQKSLRPAIYLPYPYSNIRRFNSIYSNIYMKYNFGKYAFYTKNYKNPNLRNFITNIPDSTVLVNPYLAKDEMKKAKIAARKNIGENKQLASSSSSISLLSENVIKDIRAKVQDKMKIPKLWRRNIKLERVVNVINSEKIMRSKRHTLDVIYEPESLIVNEKRSTPVPAVDKTQQQKELTRQNVLLELVVEKITCSANDTTPGYFIPGNLSQPFPGCCPQKIYSRYRSLFNL